jgi:hypothetical protein
MAGDGSLLYLTGAVDLKSRKYFVVLTEEIDRPSEFQ